jgi:hypothetical protein
VPLTGKGGCPDMRYDMELDKKTFEIFLKKTHFECKFADEETFGVQAFLHPSLKLCWLNRLRAVNVKPTFST